MHHGIIHRQAKQHGGEAHAHHADGPQHQPAQRQRRAQNQPQQRQQPEHRQPAPVRQPEQQGDDDGRPAHRTAHVVLHAPGDFCHKNRTTGVMDLNAVPVRLRLFRAQTGHHSTDGLQPARTLTISGQVHAGLDEHQSEISLRRSEHLLSLFHGKAAEIGERRHVQQIERIEGTPGDIHRRHGSCKGFLGFGEHGFQPVRHKPVGEGGERFRRLIEPQAAEQFGHLTRIFHPRRLPGHRGDQVRLLSQAGRQRIRQPLGPFGVRGAEGDDQFPRVGEMLLVKFQSLDRRFVRRQQVEDVHVKPEPAQSEADRHREQGPPPAFQEQTHGARKPSKVSPERVFSSRQPPSGLRSKRNGSGSGSPARAVCR